MFCSYSENLYASPKIFFISFSELFMDYIYVILRKYLSETIFVANIAILQTLVSIITELHAKFALWKWRFYVSHHWRLPGWAFILLSYFITNFILQLFTWISQLHLLNICSWLYGTWEWKKMAAVYNEYAVPLVMPSMLFAVLQLETLQSGELIVQWQSMILAGWYNLVQ